MMSLASAMNMPHPVYGKLTNGADALSNVQIKYENFNTKTIHYLVTNSNGFYQFELANVDASYRDGDNIKITVIFCSSNAACNKQTQISGGGNELSFDVTSVSESIVYVCLDGNEVKDLNDCPKDEVDEPDVICGDITCPDVKCDTVTCPSVEEKDCPFAPESDDGVGVGAFIISLISTFLIGSGAGIYFTKNKALGKNGGLKIYRNRLGVEILQHKHPGITGYHDPKTVHRDLNDRHPKGQLYPSYEKDEKGVWVYKE